MEKQQLSDGLKNHLNKNYENIAPYYKKKPVILEELILLTFEINRCLLVGANMATITLTNYLLENLLKIALMKDEQKFLPIEAPWDKNLEKLDDKYTSWALEKTINACCARSLISKEQKKQLLNFKEKYRNGFSHSSRRLILKDFESPHKPNDIRTLLRKSSENQALEVFMFSKENALSYYDYVFHLIFDIEKNLTDKHSLL